MVIPRQRPSSTTTRIKGMRMTRIFYELRKSWSFVKSVEFAKFALAPQGALFYRDKVDRAPLALIISGNWHICFKAIWGIVFWILIYLSYFCSLSPLTCCFLSIFYQIITTDYSDSSWFRIKTSTCQNGASIIRGFRSFSCSLKRRVSRYPPHPEAIFHHNKD